MGDEAQSGVARIMKPAVGFEAYIQGTRAAETVGSVESEKVPFFEWIDRKPPNPLDPLSGTPGYASNLLNYMPVPKGATVQLKIPFIPGGGSIPVFYRYFISFRDSNLQRSNDFAKRGETRPYHIPYQSPGQPDTTAPPGSQDRVVIPAYLDSLAVHVPPPPPYGLGSQPAFNANPVWTNPQVIIPRPYILRAPLIAAGTRAIHQQGILDPAAFTVEAGASAGNTFEIVCAGDEMIIEADREFTGLEGTDPGTTPFWDFSDTDSGFSDFYGNGSLHTPHTPIPELGIYVYILAAP